MKAWNETWKTGEGRAPWLEPDPFVFELISRFKEEGIEKVLDLGFGVGRHTILFAKEGFQVYGIDTSETALSYTSQWAEKEKLSLELKVGEMSRLPFNSESFDLIIAWNVIYHGIADYINQTLKELKRCLRLNGYLLCTLISTRHNKYGLGKEIERNTFVINEEEEKNHPHHYFNKEEINQYLSGFTLLSCRDLEQLQPESFHWNILARLISK